MLCSETATAVKGKPFSSCTRTSKPVARPEPLGLHNHQVVNSRNRCCVSLEKFSLKDVGHNQGQRSRRTPSYPGSLSSRPPRLIKHIDLIVIVIFFFPPPRRNSSSPSSSHCVASVHQDTTHSSRVSAGPATTTTLQDSSPFHSCAVAGLESPSQGSVSTWSGGSVCKSEPPGEN